MESVNTYFDFLLLYISLLLSIVILIYFFYKNNFNVWEKQGVNGPKPIPIFGTSLEQLYTPLPSIINRRHEMYGKIYGFYEQSKPAISIADPELLRFIMVKDSDIFINKRGNPSTNPLLRKTLLSLRGEKWKRTRAIVSPTFTSGKIKKMTLLINDCIKNLLENIDSKLEKNEEIDAKLLYGAFTMDVIASCAFATKTNAHKNLDDPFVFHATQFFKLQKWRLLAFFLLPNFVKRALKFNFISSHIVEFFKTTTQEIIKQRKENNIRGTDFLQLLLDSEKSANVVSDVKDINAEQLNNENQEELEKNAKLLMTKDVGKLTEEEVLAQCLIFFVAGFETTASLLSYATYAMAVNPECQNLLYEEVKQYFDINNEINYETVNKMKYLNAFINETLRLYTPIVRVDREAGRDYNLPNTDIVIPKGALVQIPLYTIHNDEDYFPEPNTFKPDRFLPENIGEIKPFTFMPFGSGPRNCVAMRFALMEAKLTLCNVILRYKFVKSENTDIPLKMSSLKFVLLPVERVIVGCQRRVL